jgi:hypothetical protein
MGPPSVVEEKAPDTWLEEAHASKKTASNVTDLSRRKNATTGQFGCVCETGGFGASARRLLERRWMTRAT